MCPDQTIAYKEGGHYRDADFSDASTYTITNYVGRKGATGNGGELALDLSEPILNALVESFDVVFNHTTLEHLYEARQLRGSASSPATLSLS